MSLRDLLQFHNLCFQLYYNSFFCIYDLTYNKGLYKLSKNHNQLSASRTPNS